MDIKKRMIVFQLFSRTKPNQYKYLSFACINCEFDDFISSLGGIFAFWLFACFYRAVATDADNDENVQFLSLDSKISRGKICGKMFGVY